MDKRSPSRRSVLSLLGVGLTAGLAGCNSLTGTEPAPDSSEQNGNTTSETPNISVNISTESQPAKLPSIWTDSQNIEDFQARFSVESSGQPTQVTVSNGKVEINQDSKQWNDGSVTVHPCQMTRGEQKFTATARKGEATATDTATATKSTPGNYKIDVVPQRNEELRETIQNNSDEENYLEQRGSFITEDPTIDTYSSHEQLGFDKLEVDLAALEWRHDNDYEELAPDPQTDPSTETSQLLQSMNQDTGDPKKEAVKNNAVLVPYPNSSGGRDPGTWDYEAFSSSNTLGEALDWMHPYLFNWNHMVTDEGPISTEDYVYAPVFEQGIEQNTDIEVHAWDFELDEHGNGLIYGKNPDGTEELRVMETVAAPLTHGYHKLIEDSEYLEPGTEGFNAYWHPLRFGGEHSNSKRWDFEGEKRRAAGAVGKMATSANVSPLMNQDVNRGMESTEHIAPTTEYMADFTEKLRTFNENDADFQELYNQSKIMNKLLHDADNNYVIFGDTENPQYARVEDESLISEVWQDEEGQYDDFDQYLEDNPQHSMSAEGVNAALEGENEELGQHTLAGA